MANFGSGILEPTPDNVKKAFPESNEPPADLSSVMIKLGLFTASMAILPISSYFVSLNLIWGGNTTGAGLTAAGVANLILGGYVWVAMKEDGKMSIDISKEKKSE